MFRHYFYLTQDVVAIVTTISLLVHWISVNIVLIRISEYKKSVAGLLFVINTAIYLDLESRDTFG